MYRVENDIIFEEMKLKDKLYISEQSNSCSTVLLKESKINCWVEMTIDNYWIYHKPTIEEQCEEKMSPAEKVW
jgi:hypothetical protein